MWERGWVRVCRCMCGCVLVRVWVLACAYDESVCLCVAVRLWLRVCMWMRIWACWWVPVWVR